MMIIAKKLLYLKIFNNHIIAEKTCLYVTIQAFIKRNLSCQEYYLILTLTHRTNASKQAV